MTELSGVRLYCIVDQVGARFDMELARNEKDNLTYSFLLYLTVSFINCPSKAGNSAPFHYLCIISNMYCSSDMIKKALFASFYTNKPHADS